MSYHRPPPSCSWQTLLAVPLTLSIVVLIILYLFSPEGVRARDPMVEDRDSAASLSLEAPV